MALAALALTVNPMIEQLVEVEQFGVDRRSWVVVHLEPGLSSTEAVQVETDLLTLGGVDGITDSTKRELGLFRAIDTPVSDLENYRTLGLDGELDAIAVAQNARALPGVDSGYPHVAQPPPSHVRLSQRLAPWGGLVLVALALILSVRLAVSRARDGRSGSRSMRWLRLVVTVVLPVTATALGASLLAAVVWPSLVYPLISRSASHLISGRLVLQPGLEFTLYAGVVMTVLCLLAVTLIDHAPPKHLT